MDPGSELRGRLIRGPRPIDTQEDFLGQILGGGMVAGVMQEEGDKPVLPGDNEIGEGISVAIAHAEHELRGGIAHRLRHHRRIRGHAPIMPSGAEVFNQRETSPGEMHRLPT